MQRRSNAEEILNMFERVHTMTDYHDGPLQGIADFRGKPHAYSRPFNHSKNEYENWYELRPVDEETFKLALEDWAIWLRWEDAFHAGQAPPDTHPALPADRSRHDEIARLLSARLVALPGPSTRARGSFRPTPRHETMGRGRWMEAEWTLDD
jgi:hypothetical protein